MNGSAIGDERLDEALRAAEERYVAATSESRRFYDRACMSMPGGNTRSVLFFDPYPLTIVRGEGAILWDADGRRYVDFLGEYTAGLFGHSNPEIRSAVESALRSGTVLGAPNRYEVELSRLICERFPSCDMLRFCNSGTEANLMAISTARAVTGRTDIMVFRGAYHGGVLYFAGEGSPLNVPYPFLIGQYNDLKTTVSLIERHARSIAAIVVEPMMGAAGVIPGDPEFLHGLRDAAARHDIVLVFDEVMTSRLAPGGLQSQLGIKPDITTFGKYLGGGLTFGAFGGRGEIMCRFDPRREDAFPHAGTFNNNVLTMAAGTVGLRDVFTSDVAVRLSERGDDLRERLNEIGRDHDVPVQATGTGSIIGLHFQREPIRRPGDTQRTSERVRAFFHLEMLLRGFYFARRGLISLSLPLIDNDVDRFVEAFAEVVKRAAFASDR